MENYKWGISTNWHFPIPVILALVVVVLVHGQQQESQIAGSQVPLIQQFQHKNQHYMKNAFNSGVLVNKIFKRTQTPIKRQDKGAHDGNSHQQIGNPKGYGYNYEEKPHGHGGKNVDSTLDDLLEVMGPHMFLLPFVLTALPLAIPAVPLSYILTRSAPATIPELINQFMEFATQINEQTMSQHESTTVAGSGSSGGGHGG